MRPMIFFLALTVLTPATEAMAQTNSADEIDVGDTRHDDNDTSKLGLLGLLGLAGLLGLKRREPDIHVDARRAETTTGRCGDWPRIPSFVVDHRLNPRRRRRSSRIP